jgi:hypothetical protein
VIDDLVPAFNDAVAETALVRMTIVLQREPNNHPVGADCWSKQPAVRYFDPLLGEITFPAMKDLLDWWAACFAMRDKAPRLSSPFPGAFDHFGTKCFGRIYRVSTATV